MVGHHALAADLFLINGRVRTMDSHDTVAQAVAVRDGKIVAVGTTAEIESLAGATTQVIDLDGRTAMPGLTDCHVHLASDSSRAVEAVECRDLYDASMDSVEALMTRIGPWATSTPPGEWIVARGSPLADFRLHERHLPTRAELDYAAPCNPTYISFGAHVIIANTLALRERGVTRDTPSPQGGTVVAISRWTAIDTHPRPSYTGPTTSYEPLDTRVEALWQRTACPGIWSMAVAV